MEWVETVGKTLEEARDRALDQLGVDEQDAEIVIVDEPRPGLFGRVRGEARVRARVQPRAPRPKVERRGRRPKRGANESSGSAETESATPASVRSSRTTAKKKAAGRGRTSSEASTKSSTPSSRRGATKDPTPSADEATDKEARVTITAKEQAELVEEFLVGLGAAFGIAGACEIEEVTEDLYEVRLDGEGDLGVLIGPKAVTLQAVQELAKAMVNRRVDGEREGRFRIDIGGYRAKRSQALARFTAQVAEQVLETGTSKALEPMGAADRKVVHDTVNEIEGVRTISEGQEPRRRVRILVDGDDRDDDGED